MIYVMYIIFLNLIISENVAITKAYNGTHDRIFKGIKATEGQFPYMVFVISGLYQPVKRLTSVCSGSLIQFNTILTAAHCFNKLAPSNVVVVMGLADARRYFMHRLINPFSVKYNSTTLQEAIAQKIHYHPYVYKNYDMAIIKIAISFIKTTYVNTIPFTLDQYPLKMRCSIPGYGKNEDGDAGRLAYFTTTEVQKDLRRCGAPADNPFSYCLNVLDPNEPKACKGDSGAPLACHLKVYGIQVRYVYMKGANASRRCGAIGSMGFLSLAASEVDVKFLTVHSKELVSSSNQLLPEFYVLITVLLFIGCKL